MVLPLDRFASFIPMERTRATRARPQTRSTHTQTEPSDVASTPISEGKQ